LNRALISRAKIHVGPKAPRATSKGMNQILKERDARCGEVSTKEKGETKTPAKLKTRGEEKETTGPGAASKPFETAAVEDWSMILQKGLACLPLWQQFILPDMWVMEQAWESLPKDFWQIPQGVRATRTPRISVIRLRRRSDLSMVGCYILSGGDVKCGPLEPHRLSIIFQLIPSIVQKGFTFYDIGHGPILSAPLGDQGAWALYFSNQSDRGLLSGWIFRISPKHPRDS
jgi:hypothetical protein